MSTAKQFNRTVEFNSTQPIVGNSGGAVYIAGGLNVSNLNVSSFVTIANLTITNSLNTSTGNSLVSSQWINVPAGISYTSANVGIGTTSPGFSLDISGGARITGSVTTGNLNVVSGASIPNILTTTISVGSIIATNGVTSGNIRLNSSAIYFRGNNDLGHGLIWNSGPDGPLLWGLVGGRLATSTNGNNVVMGWNSNGISASNALFTNVSASNIIISTNVSSAALYSLNQTTTNIVGTTISSGTLLATNSTTVNLVATNITSSNLISASGQSLNLNANTNAIYFQQGATVMGYYNTTVFGPQSDNTISLGSSGVRFANSYVLNTLTTNITSSNINSSNATIDNISTSLLTVGNLVGTLMTLGNIISTFNTMNTLSMITGITTPNLFSTNITVSSLFSTFITASNIQTTFINTTNIGTTFTSAANLLVTTVTSAANLYSTNISTGSIVAAGSTRIVNTTATSIGTLSVSGPGNSGYLPATTTSGQLASFYGPGGAGVISNFDLSTYIPNSTQLFLPAVRFSMLDTGSGNSNFNILTRNGGNGTGSMASRILIDASGNVGINTSVPNFTLDISGGSRIHTVNTSASLTLVVQSNASSGGAQSTYGSLFLGHISNGAVGVTANFDLSTYLPSINAANLPTTRFSITDLGLANNSFNILTRTAGIGSASMASRIFIDGSGNVGINTSTPSALLDVNGSLEVLGNSNTIGNIFTTGGNVGINTINPNFTLDINGTTRINNTRGLLIGTSTDIDQQRMISALNSALPNGGVSYITLGQGATQNNQAEFAFNYNSTGSVLNCASIGVFGGDVRLNVNRNTVAIGTTTNSTSKLVIYESTGTSANATSGTLFIQRGNTGGSSSIVFPSVSNINSDYGYIQFIDSVANAGFTSYNYFGASGTETAALLLGCENDGGVGSGPDSVIISPIGNVAITPRNNVTYISGSVGINTTAPAFRLDVAGVIKTGNSVASNAAAYSNIILTPLTGQGNQVEINFNNAAGYRNYIYTNSPFGMAIGGNGALAFQTATSAGSPTTFMTLTSGGSLGINQTNPSEVLHVTGNGRFTGNVQNGGFDFVLGNNDQSTRGNSGQSRALVKATGNILIVNFNGDYTGGTEVQSSLNITGTISRSGVLLPRFDNGTFTTASSGIIPILFSNSTYNFVEIKVRYQVSSANCNVVLNGSTSANGSSPFGATELAETTVRHSSQNTPIYTTNGFISQTTEALNIDNNFTIKITRATGGTNARNHYSFDTVYCFAGVGTARVNGMGYLVTATNLSTQLLSILMTPSAGTITGTWSTQHSY